jgi:hypothetical protein
MTTSLYILFSYVYTDWATESAFRQTMNQSVQGLQSSKAHCLSASLGDEMQLEDH